MICQEKNHFLVVQKLRSHLDKNFWTQEDLLRLGVVGWALGQSAPAGGVRPWRKLWTAIVLNPPKAMRAYGKSVYTSRN